jgi:phosphodiesterase/alkaline phosphatase D-like protein
VRLIIASCCKIQDAAVDLGVWTEIAGANPDALLLLGDNIYLEDDQRTDPVALKDELDARYRELMAEQHFKALLEQLAAGQRPVLACYDDHDFLGNDRYGGDVASALREAARQAFIACWHPQQTEDDVYSRLSLGEVDVIVLDTRYYRENRLAPGSATRDAVLGARQWTWLESELARSTSAYVVVASGSTFHNFGHAECWERYPAAFARMRDLLRGRPGALIVAGDIHTNGLYDDSGVIEIVSSGVARRGMIFGGLKRNYGILEFDPRGVDIDLRSNKVYSRFSTRVELACWVLS